MRPTPKQDLYLGRYGGSDTHRFHGKLDELRISSAVREFHGAPTTPYVGDEPDTVALYHFDERADGVTTPNAVPDSPLHARMRIPGDNRLSGSMPEFGRALRIGSERK